MMNGVRKGGRPVLVLASARGCGSPLLCPGLLRAATAVASTSLAIAHITFQAPLTFGPNLARSPIHPISSFSYTTTFPPF